MSWAILIGCLYWAAVVLLSMHWYPTYGPLALIGSAVIAWVILAIVLFLGFWVYSTISNRSKKD